MTCNKNLKNLVRLFFLSCIVLYNFQGSLLPSGSIVCMVSVAIVMIIEGFCFVSTISNITKPIFSSLFFIIALTFFAFILSDSTAISREGTIVNSSSELLAITYIGLFVFSGYTLYNKGVIREREVVLILVLLLLQSIISYFYMRSFLLAERGYYRYTNNIGYAFVSLLPYILFTKKKYQWPIILIIFVFVLLCAKRGAIIIATLFLLYFLYIKIKDSRIKVWGIITGCIAFSFFLFVSYKVFLESEYLQIRLESTMEGSSSGRDEMYSTMFQTYLEFDNLIHYFFGKGLLASVKTVGLLAHNDWLELLLSNGLVGVLIYVLFFIQILNLSKSKNVSINNRHIVKSILIIWISKTFFSMAISDVMFAPIPLLLGIVIAMNEKEKQPITRQI